MTDTNTDPDTSQDDRVNAVESILEKAYDRITDRSNKEPRTHEGTDWNAIDNTMNAAFDRAERQATDHDAKSMPKVHGANLEETMDAARDWITLPDKEKRERRAAANALDESKAAAKAAGLTLQEYEAVLLRAELQRGNANAVEGKADASTAKDTASEYGAFQPYADRLKTIAPDREPTEAMNEIMEIVEMVQTDPEAAIKEIRNRTGADDPWENDERVQSYLDTLEWRTMLTWSNNDPLATLESFLEHFAKENDLDDPAIEKVIEQLKSPAFNRTGRITGDLRKALKAMRDGETKAKAKRKGISKDERGRSVDATLERVANSVFARGAAR